MLRNFVEFVADLVHLGFLLGAERAAKDPVFPNLLESPAALEVRARLGRLNVTGQALPGPDPAAPALPARAQAAGALPAPAAGAAGQQKRGPVAPPRGEREKLSAAATLAQAQIDNGEGRQ